MDSEFARQGQERANHSLDHQGQSRFVHANCEQTNLMNYSLSTTCTYMYVDVS